MTPKPVLKRVCGYERTHRKTLCCHRLVLHHICGSWSRGRLAMTTAQEIAAIETALATCQCPQQINELEHRLLELQTTA